MPTIEISSFFMLPLILAIGFFMGAVVGFLSFNRAAQIALRKRIESAHYASKPIDWISESRRAKRTNVMNVLVSVVAPVLDAAGVAAANDTITFISYLIDISPTGAGFLGNYFLPVGTNIRIACAEKNMAFPYREAKVCYDRIASNGIRIGVEFLEALENLKTI